MGLIAISPFIKYNGYSIGSIRTLGAYQSTWCNYYWPTTYAISGLRRYLTVNTDEITYPPIFILNNYELDSGAAMNVYVRRERIRLGSKETALCQEYGQLSWSNGRQINIWPSLSSAERANLPIVTITLMFAFNFSFYGYSNRWIIYEIGNSYVQILAVGPSNGNMYTPVCTYTPVNALTRGNIIVTKIPKNITTY